MRVLRAVKEVPYWEIEPVSDRLAIYQGRYYTTREDLKTYPDIVHLEDIE